MSKILRKEGFRVTVYPKHMGHFGSISVSDSFIYGMTNEGASRKERDYQERCEEIAEQIRRHVDNVSSVHIEWDDASSCEHCGYAWTEDNPHYNGGCCQKDQDAYEASIKVTA